MNLPEVYLGKRQEQHLRAEERQWLGLVETIPVPLDPVSEVEQRVLAEKLNQLLSDMPPTVRVALERHVLDEQSYGEIAQSLGETREALQNKIFSELRKIRRKNGLRWDVGQFLR